jgi:hypothetical protein
MSEHLKECIDRIETRIENHQALIIDYGRAIDDLTQRVIMLEGLLRLTLGQYDNS